mmetsp:Transcript_139388/g.242371  ORF Transcript_139388/g.242371 Transcript_139388/m.242371 type:complete len:275 (-) Transcript_139388:955-1779(-)
MGVCFMRHTVGAHSTVLGVPGAVVRLTLVMTLKDAQVVSGAGIEVLAGVAAVGLAAGGKAVAVDLCGELKLVGRGRACPVHQNPRPHEVCQTTLHGLHVVRLGLARVGKGDARYDELEDWAVGIVVGDGGVPPELHFPRLGVGHDVLRGVSPLKVLQPAEFLKPKAFWEGHPDLIASIRAGEANGQRHLPIVHPRDAGEHSGVHAGGRQHSSDGADVDIMHPAMDVPCVCDVARVVDSVPCEHVAQCLLVLGALDEVEHVLVPRNVSGRAGIRQ